MHLSTLGRLELQDSGFSRPKLLLLLAYLSLEGPRERRFLAELFWPEAQQPLASLRVALAQLHKGAPGSISSAGQLISSSVTMDAVTLLDRLEQGELAGVLRLYDGPFLAGTQLRSRSTELEEWVLATRELIAERVRNALLQKAVRDAAAGDFTAAADRAACAWRLPAAPYPTFEELRSMHLLLCAGGNTLAVQVAREALTFGVTLDPSPAPARLALAGTRPGAPLGLPLHNSSFVGRDPELLQLEQLLARRDTRLVTLCGPGGAGKTRLAVQAAQGGQRNELWPGGVTFVPLEQLSEAAHIPAAITEALDLRLSGRDQPLTALSEAIGKREMLLILDNFEQLTAGANILSQLLRNCPGLVLLVTSRERLNLEGEHVISLQGLPVPAASEQLHAVQYGAVQLFLRRARQVQPDFTLDAATLPHVLDICERVAGLPLGIELAAAWVRALPVSEIASELSGNLDLLTDGARDLPERQRSMRATLEHSWKLLPAAEQEVLSRLAVFAGGFSRQAAAAVTGATLPLLTRLADKSLLQVTPAGRFGQHPLVQQFTHEKLAHSEAAFESTRLKHARYCLQLANTATAQLRGPQQAQLLARLDVEHDNMRAALTVLLGQGRSGLTLELASALTPYWSLRGQLLSEGREWLRRALAQSGKVAASVQAAAFGAAGRLAFSQGDFAAASASLQEALSLQRSLPDRSGLAAALHNLGNTLVLQANFAAAELHFQESLTLRERLADQRGAASTLHSLGNLARRQGNLGAALERYLQCLGIVIELGDQHGMAQALVGVGSVKLEQDDLAAARSYLEQGLQVHRELGSLIGMAAALTNLAEVSRRGGDLSSARAQLGEVLQLREQIGDAPGVARARAALSEVV